LIMDDSNYDTLRYEVADGIAKIVFDRPPANLIDRQSTLEYHAALLRADADPEARVIVVSGAGRGLSGGVDLNFLESFDAAQMKDFLQLFYVETLRIVRGLRKPIIAAVQPRTMRISLTRVYPISRPRRECTSGSCKNCSGACAPPS
jgi:enoyl-CoA hydratase/carnithine racemase